MRILLAVMITLAGLTASADAAFMYSFEFGQSDYVVDPGSGSFSVNLYLRETTTDGDVPRLATGSTDGLFQIGLDLNYGSFTGSQATLSGFTPAPGVNQPGSPPFSHNVGTSAKIQYFSADAFNGYEVTPSAPNTAVAYLGTFTFNAPVLGGVTTLTLSDRDTTPGADDNLFTDGVVIDGFASYGSATISAVPEPTTIGALGLLAVGAVGAAKKRLNRRKKR